MIDPSILDAMVASGCTAEQIATVVKAAIASCDDRKAAKRANNAERQRRFRERNADNALRGVTNAEQVSPKEIPPTPPKEITPSREPNGSSTKRATRLPADWVIPDGWLAEAVNAGLSVGEARAAAGRMHNWSLSDKNGAKLDWHATWRNWFDREKRSAMSRHRSTSPPPPQPQTGASIWTSEAIAMGMFNDESSSKSNGHILEGDAAEHRRRSGEIGNVAVAPGPGWHRGGSA